MTENMRFPNFGIVTTRATKDLFSPIVCDRVPAHKLGSRYDISYCFPLFLYKDVLDKRRSSNNISFTFDDPFAGQDRIENIAPDYRAWLNARYSRSPSPEEVFGYVYAILSAPAYRAAYADFLRTDFPRIPFPESYAHFEALAALGWRLSETQLMRRVQRDTPEARWIGKGDDVVDRPRWSEAERTIWINPNQGFAGVAAQVWEFTVGGYQVLDKYLKSRRGRVLSLDEIEHVEKVVGVIGSTIRQMGLSHRLPRARRGRWHR